MYENEYVMVTPQILLNAMQDEVNAIAYYNQLIELTEDTQDIELLQDIRNDEMSHFTALSELYDLLTNLEVPVFEAEVPQITTFIDGVKQAFFNELEDSEFYRGLALNCANPSQRMFFDIMADENKHASWLHYIYTKSLEYCCEQVVEPEPGPEPGPEPTPEPPPVICSGISHTVQPGESLYSIGMEYGVSVEAILAENPQITDPANIYVGQVICIPCSGMTYIIQPGDSLWTIATQYGITVNDLLAANPRVSNPENIIAGQVLCIPVQYPESYRDSLTYLYGGTAERYLEQLSNTQNSITTVCPDFFELDANGNLLLAYTEKLNMAFIDNVHNQGILITPFLTNHWNRSLGITALSNREFLSDQMATAVDLYHFDGVNIDIENVTHDQQDIYVDFVRLLREKLPDDKIISVAVAANPNGWTLGWHGSYDYKRLSEYCDYLMIMAYDESYQGGDEGPISSKSFFDRSIQYAFDQEVPQSKIVVGIPFYGRYWKQGEEMGGYGIAAADVEFLLANYEGSVYYDSILESAFATVTIRPGEDEPVVWGGQVLTAGTYHIWYDNPQATRNKLETINNNDLRGAGSWLLGQEILSIWNFYSQTLNQ